MIFSMLMIVAGLEATGALDLMLGLTLPLLEGRPAWVLLLAIYALTSALTRGDHQQRRRRRAHAAGHRPRVRARRRSAAVRRGGDVRQRSASFATPVGYQTNTLVYGAGDYRFTDFLKIGVPMNVIVGIAVVLAIPVFFPIG